MDSFFGMTTPPLDIGSGVTGMTRGRFLDRGDAVILLAEAVSDGGCGEAALMKDCRVRGMLPRMWLCLIVTNNDRVFVVVLTKAVALPNMHRLQQQ